MLVIVNYLINIHVLRVPPEDLHSYVWGLLSIFFTFVFVWSLLGLSLYTFDLLFIVLLNDYFYFSRILRELMEED